MKLTKRVVAFTVTMLMLAACLITTVSAETYTYAFDKIGTEQNINDDVTYQKYVLTSGENGTTVDAVAMEFDPADGYLPMAFMGYAGTSGTLATQYGVAVDKYGYEVVGAINGSFFSMDSGSTGSRGAYGTLVDYIISNGKVMSAHAGDACEVVAFASDGTFKVVNSLIDYKLYIKGSEVGSLYYVNKTSGTNEKDKSGNPVANYWSNGFYYFDTSCGKTADTNTSVEGYNVLCKKLDNTDLVVGGTLKGEVISVTKGTEAAQVSEGYNDVSDKFDIFVKSTSPNAKFVKDLEAGDSISISVTETVEESREIIENANSVIENVGWLVKDGVDQTQIKSTIGTHSVTLKARWTAFGRKADGSYVLFTSDSTVTAGDSYSTGNSPSATLRDVAKAMIGLGCVDVIRMDGGGSVAMYAQDDGSGNPGYLMATQGYVRPVADCILIVKKSSTVDTALNTALDSAVAAAKDGGKDSDVAVAEAIKAIEDYKTENEVLVSGDVRSLLMRLQAALSGKDKLNELVTKAVSVNFADYSEEVLTNLRAAYAEGLAVLGSDEATSEQVTEATKNIEKWLALTGEQGFVISEGKSYTVTGGSNYTNGGWPDPNILHDDGKRLTDGRKDVLEGSSNVYSAWGSSSKPAITVDLEEVQKFDKVALHVGAISDWGISTPYSFTVEISENGTDFEKIATVSKGANDKNGYTLLDEKLVDTAGANSWQAYVDEVSFEQGVSARYVRFTTVPTGQFTWINEVEVIKTVHPVTNAVYINGVNSTIYENDAHVFTSDMGNLRQANANAKFTQNLFLKWSEADGCYIVTDNVAQYEVHPWPNQEDPDLTLAADEILLAVHGDSGVGNANRTLVRNGFKVGDKVAVYGVDVENGKLTLASYAIKLETAVEDPYGIGDVNGDDEIDAADYILVKRHIIGNKPLGEDRVKRADINGDGEVDAADYILIKRHIIGNKLIPGAKA